MYSKFASLPQEKEHTRVWHVKNQYFPPCHVTIVNHIAWVTHTQVKRAWWKLQRENPGIYHVLSYVDWKGKPKEGRKYFYFGALLSLLVGIVIWNNKKSTNYINTTRFPFNYNKKMANFFRKLFLKFFIWQISSAGSQRVPDSSKEWCLSEGTF